jgi:hypothetical protein
MRGLIKIHKHEAPIRPAVNWKNAPAYKLEKLLTKNFMHTSRYGIPSTSRILSSSSTILPIFHITKN